jgi:glycosyltransferase involved in cell wall biosynthesis
MRIAIINWSSRLVGGAETYLSRTIPELARLGHELAFMHEIDTPANREQIALPEGVPAWCVSELGARRALDALRDWGPDLIYTHILETPSLEAETLKIAPAIFFAHAYYGTCISGAKTFKSPTVRPCDRRFGWECLLQYYPRRCGGLSPVTMLRLFHLQSKRLDLLHQYAAIVTHSTHMRSEYLKHGLPPERVYNLSYCSDVFDQPSLGQDQPESSDPLFSEEPDDAVMDKPYHHLLFAGRMDFLKGGRTFIDALPEVRKALGLPLRITFAGDGPDRRAWERLAAGVSHQVEGLRIEFVGWVQRNRLESLYQDCDLLVYPSLWPEPCGLAGPEAGLYGVPVAAFDVGGFSEWLIDGFNGHLAPGDPPTSHGLAQTIVSCLQDPATHKRLRRGAVQAARQFSLKNHMTALTMVFEEIMPAKASNLSATAQR